MQQIPQMIQSLVLLNRSSVNWMAKTSMKSWMPVRLLCIYCLIYIIYKSREQEFFISLTLFHFYFATGLSKLASVPAGGAVVVSAAAAGGGGGGAAPAAEAPAGG